MSFKLLTTLLLTFLLQCILTFSLQEACNDPEKGLKRVLNTPPVVCSSFLDCNACSGNTSCMWLNNTCGEDDPNAILTEEYFSPYYFGPNDTTSSTSVNDPDCPDSLGNYTIVLDDIVGETLEIRHNTSSESFFCGWNIETDIDKTVTITLTRVEENHEEVAIIYNSSGAITNLTNRDLTECSSNGYSVEINDTSFVWIKARTQRAIVNYDILIQQQGIDFGTPAVLTNNKALVEFVAVFLATTITVLIIALITFALCRRGGMSANKKKDRLKKKAGKLADAKEGHTLDVMDSMLSGTHENMPNNYQVSTCKICALRFESTDQVHLTNECLHLFHSHCLKRWYNMVTKLGDLSCPTCNTKNTPKEGDLEDDAYVKEEFEEPENFISEEDIVYHE